MTNLTPEILLRAYASGVFPMANDRQDSTLYWIDPDMRGVLPLESFHMSRRLTRTVRGDTFDVRVDTAFREVIRSCAEPSAGRDTTWINDQIMDLYGSLHENGNAHSVECWCEHDLVGGLYGVSIGGAFFGESMFTRKTDASKVALVHLVARLRQGGYRLLDTQFVTKHLARFGAIEISREEYHRRLAEALEHEADFYSLPPVLSGTGALQSITQTS